MNPRNWPEKPQNYVGRCKRCDELFRGLKGRIQGGVCALCADKVELEGDAIGARYYQGEEKLVQVLRWLRVQTVKGIVLEENPEWVSATYEMTHDGIVRR